MSPEYNEELEYNDRLTYERASRYRRIVELLLPRAAVIQKALLLAINNGWVELVNTFLKDRRYTLKLVAGEVSTPAGMKVFSLFQDNLFKAST